MRDLDVLEGTLEVLERRLEGDVDEDSTLWKSGEGGWSGTVEGDGEREEKERWAG